MARATTTTWLRVHGADKYKRLAKDLKAAGRGDLQRKLTRSIRKEGGAALTAVQAAWLTVEVTSEGDGGRSSGLRKRVAAATRISILGSGIRIRVEGKRVDPVYGRSLAYYLDDLGRKPWRHPVFADKDRPKSEWTWTQQKGEEVFYKTLVDYEEKWRAGIEQVMDEVAAELAAG